MPKPNESDFLSDRHLFAILISWIATSIVTALFGGCAGVVTDEPLPSYAMSFVFDPACEAPPVDAGLAVDLWREWGVAVVEVTDPPAEHPVDTTVCPTVGSPHQPHAGWTVVADDGLASIEIDATLTVGTFGRILTHEFGHALMTGTDADHLPEGMPGIMSAIVAPIDEWSDADVEHLEAHGFERSGR